MSSSHESPSPPSPSAKGLGLVIPCYRESLRLPLFLPDLCRELEAAHIPNLQVLVVDDGSGDTEAEALRQCVEEQRNRHPFLLPPLFLPRNMGKGATVYAGWDHVFDDVGHLAFVDADGAVPAAETVRFLLLGLKSPPEEALFASRLGGRPVDRRLLRRIGGWGFRFLVHLLFRFSIADTQCGLKIIPSTAYRNIRKHLHRPDFIFDIELAAKLQTNGTPIRSEPVEWHEQGGSHLGLRDAITMGLALLTLRIRLPRLRLPD